MDSSPMTVLRVLAFAVGFVVTVLALLSAIRTVVLPRAATDRISRAVFRTNYRLFTGVARRMSSFATRDRVMALFAPVSLLQLPVAWIAVVLAGYMAMFWGAGVDGWRQAFSVSGSSLLTLGFSPVDGLFQTTLAFSEATIGLGIVALLITYLPTMYGAFRSREAGVALLEVRAGAPPSGVEMLERFHRIRWTEHLPEIFGGWEEWFIDLEESHTSLPALAFFRSPQPDRSWVTASGAVLDAASLAASSVEWPPAPQTQVLIRAGYVALRRIADSFGIPYDPDPAPHDPISVTRSEYDAVYDRLTAAGVPMKPDRDQAWRDFAGWRVNYDRVLLGLAALTLAPPAPWSSDRAPAFKHSPPRMRRWGQRRRRSSTGT